MRGSRSVTFHQIFASEYDSIDVFELATPSFFLSPKIHSSRDFFRRNAEISPHETANENHTKREIHKPEILPTEPSN